MDYSKMYAKLKGETEEKEYFEITLTFNMIPPEKSENHYGTGYYMSVLIHYDVFSYPIRDEKKLIDVRYEKTTDVEILANRWIKDFFGNNVKDEDITIWFE